MTLGRSLGPYELIAQIGAGGSSDVYRAVDARLDRVVAVKVRRVLQPGRRSSHPGFEREARAISKLHHPHICALYDVGREGDVDYLVMEHLLGETLAVRLKRGPLPVDQVLRYGSQVADALGHVHRHGFVHRDVKPSNLMLTDAGIKLLDFGVVSKVAPPSGMANAIGIVEDRTATIDSSVVGTFAYMAPEQAEGYEADSRSDIFSLGLVLYEMASGQHAFDSRSPAGVVAAILSSEPRPLRLDSARLSGLLGHVIGQCLAKSPDDRWQNVEDVRSELDWIGSTLVDPAPPDAKVSTTAARGRSMIWTLAAFGAAVGAVALGGHGTPQDADRNPAPAAMFQVAPPPGNRDASFALEAALAPDGRYLVFPIRTASGRGRLWLRPLASTTARELDGTDGARSPFWSSDSRHVAFFVKDQLKMVDIAGREERVISTVPTGLSPSGSFSPDGTIVIGSYNTGLFQLSAAGGPAVPLTTFDPSQGEQGHAFPQFLPDARHIVFLVRSTRPDRAGVYVTSLDTPNQRTRLVGAVSKASYAPPGYLLLERYGALFAQPFDADALRLAGPEVELDPLVMHTINGRVAFSVSQNGVLTYQALDAAELTWFDRSGKRLGSAGRTNFAETIDMSSDGQRLASSRPDPKTGRYGLWITEPSSASERNITDERSNDVAPLWSPDGTQLAFASDRGGHFDLYIKSLEDGHETELLQSGNDKWPLHWSRDGSFLLFLDGSERSELWALPLAGARRPVLVTKTRSNAALGQISPDGRWFASVSFDEGAREVIVRDFPSGQARVRVSADGGTEPAWRADGGELFYLSPSGTLMAAPIKPGEAFEVGTPVPLFATNLESRGFAGPLARNRYAVFDNGQRFLINQPGLSASAVPLTVLVNWVGRLHDLGGHGSDGKASPTR